MAEVNFDMFAKLDEAGHIVYPPHNVQTEDGRTIINAHLNLEWLTENGYEERTPEWFEEHREKHVATKQELNEYVYEEKKRIAYGSITITKDSTQYEFAMDTTSITMCNSTLALFQADIITEIEWKVYQNGNPTTITLTKAQFIAVFGFGMTVNRTAFALEGTINNQIAEMTEEELADEDYIANFKSNVTGQFNNINTDFSIDEMDTLA